MITDGVPEESTGERVVARTKGDVDSGRYDTSLPMVGDVLTSFPPLFPGPRDVSLAGLKGFYLGIRLRRETKLITWQNHERESSGS